MIHEAGDITAHRGIEHAFRVKAEHIAITALALKCAALVDALLLSAAELRRACPMYSTTIPSLGTGRVVNSPQL